MIITFCEKCGNRVSDQEIQSGRARRIDENQVVCANCSPQENKAQGAPQRKATTPARGIPQPSSRRSGPVLLPTRPTTGPVTRVPAAAAAPRSAPQKSSQPAPFPIAPVAGVGVAIVFLLILLFSGSKKEAPRPRDVPDDPPPTVAQTSDKAPPVTPVSQPKKLMVNAGRVQSVSMNAPAKIEGAIMDSALNASPNIQTTWSKVSGGEVTFENAAAKATTAKFSEPGLYVLRFSAKFGAEEATDNLKLIVNSADAAVGGKTSKNDGNGDYEGVADSVTSDQVAGWAWDKRKGNEPIDVNVYDGTTLLATVTANNSRSDLVKAGKGDGRHGFRFFLPLSVKDRQSHMIHVKIANTNRELINSPKSVSE
jgi:hypothetical protein